MHNLKHQKGTFKGLISECLFKLIYDKAILPSFHSYYKFATAFPKIDPIKREFLKKNWRTIDAVEMGKNITLYEVKGKTFYKNYLPPKFKATEYQIKVYKEAIKLGFDVYLAKVYYFMDWNFDVKLIPFEEKLFCVDKPKKYDSIKESISKK